MLSNRLPGVEIVSGCASGADSLGECYAKYKGLQIKCFPADWQTYGKKAGILRNREMADYADAALIFWDGKSRGTKNMIDEATKMGLKIKVVRYKDAGGVQTEEKPQTSCQ